jgi:Zn-dependent alcohol dehydrogenase
MDWIVVEGRGVVQIPDGVPFEQAAFIEPLNTVLKGVKLLNLAADDTVLVIGQGPIGLMHAALARAPERACSPRIFIPSATPLPPVRPHQPHPRRDARMW